MVVRTIASAALPTPLPVPPVKALPTVWRYGLTPTHNMTKLRSLAPMLRARDTSTTRLAPRFRDPAYTTPGYKQWCIRVKQRAGYHCEAVVNGHRCDRAYPEHRMYADHIVELKDGGSLTALSNGQCLCSQHHEIKTVAARVQRLRQVE